MSASRENSLFPRSANRISPDREILRFADSEEYVKMGDKNGIESENEEPVGSDFAERFMQLFSC